MTNQDKDFIDISSSADVDKVYGSERRAPRKPIKRKGKARRIVILILSIVLLLTSVATILIEGMLPNYKALEPSVKSNKNQNTSYTESTEISIAGGKNSLLSSSNVLNILLFGQDYKANEEDYGRSDTTILLSIDNVHRKLKLTSFQRDTYVYIPGYGNNKINAAFTFGGERLSIDTIEQNFGIKVDKYATVDFTSFREIINVLGGIDIELTLEEIKYINAQIDVNDQLDVTSFLKYDETKETQVLHLDGYQALWYARNRGEEALGGNPEYSFSGDDWERTSRQRKLIQTVITSLRQDASLTQLVAIANKVGPLVTTNLKKSDITFLMSNIMTYIEYDMEEMSLPTTGTWHYGTTEDGQSVIAIDDMNAAHRAIADFIYEDSVSVSSGSTSATTPTTSASTSPTQQSVTATESVDVYYDDDDEIIYY